MSWNDKTYTEIVAKHPVLEGKPESVALAVWALAKNKDMAPEDWRKLSKDTGVEVRGRAIGSARSVLGIASPAGTKPKAGKKKPGRKPGRPAKATVASAGMSGLDQVMDGIRLVQQERDQAVAMLRKIRDEIDAML